MDALVVEHGSSLRLVAQDSPEPGTGEVAIEVAACGICGTDLRALDISRFEDDTVLGHEVSGTVIAVGPEVEDRRVGERVVLMPFAVCGHCERCDRGEPFLCPVARAAGLGLGQRNGGYARQVVAPAATAYPIPDDLDLRVAALTEPVAVAVRGLRLAHLEAEQPLVVLGAGPLGLMVALIARAWGHEARVISANRFRQTRAKELDLLTATQEDILRDGGEARARTVMECVGRPGALETAVGLAGVQGTVVVLGVTHEDPENVNQTQIVCNEVTLRGSLAYDADDFQTAIDLLCSGHPTGKLITSTVSLGEAPEMVERLLQGGSAEMKVLIDPSS
jgi:(R,R)-butanediol dehydrogenase / meso-butanediol dehydrogenase / diacetyl reductase